MENKKDESKPAPKERPRFRPIPPQEERDRAYNEIRERFGFEPNADPKSE